MAADNGNASSSTTTSGGGAHSPESRITPPAPALLLPVLLAAQFVTPLAIAGVAVGLPSISVSLGADSSLLQWVVNAFNIAFAVFTLVWGFVSDRLGHERVFTIGVALCVVGSVASAMAPSLLFLDMARALGGVGAAAVITAAAALISGRFQGARRARAFAIFGTVNGLGLALGPSLSGAIVSLGGWRSVFAVHGILLLAALIGTRVLRNPNRSAGEVAEAKTAPPASSGFRALLHPGYLAMLVIPVAGAAGFVTLLTYLPAALQAAQSMTPGAAGLMMLAMTVPVLIAPTLVHTLTRRVAMRRPGRADAVHTVVCGVSLTCLVLAPLGLLGFSPDTPAMILIVILIIAGLGFGMPLGIVDGRALSFIPESAQGRAAGVLNFFRIGSEAVFVALYAVILTAMISRQPAAAGIVDEIAAGQPGHPDVYAAAMPPVLAAISACCALLLIAFVLLTRSGASRLLRDETPR